MAASASASTSTTADSNNSYSYDVFINHRGPDVKKTFASHLYHRLISHGLRVFLDYKELQEGEDLSCQIRGAIRTASVHVAIFSPTYAESEWCMKELELMLESKAPLIPVFHGVKPADVRRTRGEGVYARALHILEHKRTHDSQPRHNPSTIENWRYAFSRVAGISGLDLEAFNGDEGALLDKVVEVTLKKAKTLLNVARYPKTQSDVQIHSIDEGIKKLNNRLSVLFSQVSLVREELHRVERLRSLEMLKASTCVERVSSLELLSCGKLKSIRFSTQLTQLRVLDVSGCTSLKSILFTRLTQLRVLEVSHCNELQDLPGVEHLRSLKMLEAYQCVKLKSIPFGADDAASKSKCLWMLSRMHCRL